jgi:hypothetical protein
MRRAGSCTPPCLVGWRFASSRYAPLRAEIVSFWLRPEHRAMDSWKAHEDINDVMLVTALQPDGFLTLWPGALSPSPESP